VRTYRVDRTVAAWTAAGLLVTAGYPIMGDGTPAAAFVHDGFVLLTLVAVPAGIRRRRPVHRLGHRLAQDYHFGHPTTAPDLRSAGAVPAVA
jgi:hypothetical protein